MCIETINLEVSPDEEGSALKSPKGGHDQDEPFHIWPFYYRTALEKLRRIGAGPYPYFASVTYYIGVWAFIFALAAEFVPLPAAVFYWVFNLFFTLGSFLFVLGGVFECIECEVFTSLKLDSGWIGAFLNTFGGSMFLVGSIFGFFPGQGIKASFLFGIGALIFAGGSGFMIIMWKDEQFGLTFLSALNNLGGDTGRPVVQKNDDSDEVHEEHTMSCRGSIFVMVYCLAGAMTIYECLLTLKDISFSGETAMYTSVRTFNAFLPVVLSHLFLAVNSAVIKVPNHSPFRQLYLGCRFFALLMVVGAISRMVTSLRHSVQNEYLYCQYGHFTTSPETVI